METIRAQPGSKHSGGFSVPCDHRVSVPAEHLTSVQSVLRLSLLPLSIHEAFLFTLYNVHYGFKSLH